MKRQTSPEIQQLREDVKFWWQIAKAESKAQFRGTADAMDRAIGFEKKLIALGVTPPRRPKEFVDKAQLDRDSATALKAYSALQRGRLEDAIEGVYHRKGPSEDMTMAEACEAVREMLPSGFGAPVDDKTISKAIRAQIPDWF